MVKNKYSKIYEFGGKRFRYNYEECLLEYVTFEDYEFNGDGFLEKILLAEPQVIDCQGLSNRSWKQNKYEFLEQYSDEIDSEMQWLIKEFE